ncbi:diacylglycerol kinase [Paraburkholderia sp. GAS334]|uniref:diacylglycerol kinase n=1 Tax=Paraburkholderia sp. GAS334 TaxID=3035131 RepID=UPI003D203F51
MMRRAPPTMQARTSSVRRPSADAPRAPRDAARPHPADADGAITNGIANANGIDPFDDESQPHSQSHPRPHGKGGTMQTDTETHGEPLGPDDPLAPLPFNPYKGNRGLTRAWHAMKNSLAGFQVAIREESAFRQELTLAAILLPIGLIVPVEPVARVLLLGSVLLVLIVELLNSSVEAAIDRISLERHELSRRAKDLGSAAVMVALVMCLMTWGLVLTPLVLRWIEAWR